MSQAKTHATYLFEHWKQSGEKGFVEMLFSRIVKSNNLTPRQASAVATEFRNLIKAHPART